MGKTVRGLYLNSETGDCLSETLETQDARSYERLLGWTSNWGDLRFSYLCVGTQGYYAISNRNNDDKRTTIRCFNDEGKFKEAIHGSVFICKVDEGPDDQRTAVSMTEQELSELMRSVEYVSHEHDLQFPRLDMTFSPVFPPQMLR